MLIAFVVLYLLASIAIGLVAGGLCYSATLLRSRLKVDVALAGVACDVDGVQGVGAGCENGRHGP